MPKLRARHALVAALVSSALSAAPPAAAQQAPPAEPSVGETPLAELPLVRPLLQDNLVALVHWWDGGPNARVTVFARVRAPLATVMRTVGEPERYPALLPALSSCEVLSRAGSSTAFRATVSVGPVRLTAEAVLRARGDRRVDFWLTDSPVGPAAARWELSPEPDGSTLVALTVVSDPSQGGWLLRQLVGNSQTASTSGGLTAATSLLVGVRHGAERAAAVPPVAAVAEGALHAPTQGPWLALLDRYNTVLLRTDAAGELTQVTTGDRGGHTLARVLERLRGAAHWSDFWPWMHGSTPRSPTRVHLALSAPFDHDEGELELVTEPSGSARLDGVSGAFAGEQHRYDAFPAAGGESYLLYTTNAGARHLPSLYRMLTDRTPAAAHGMAAFWATTLLRSGFNSYH